MQAAAGQAQAQGWARSELSQLLQVVPASITWCERRRCNSSIIFQGPAILAEVYANCQLVRFAVFALQASLQYMPRENSSAPCQD